MRFLKIGLVIFALLPFCFSAYSQEVKVIISKNIEALGGEEALREIKSLKLTGTLEFPSSGVKYNLTIHKMHPNRYRCEMEYRGTTVVEAYDGNNVWHIVPFDGIDSPTPVKDEIQASKIKSEAYIFSPLVEWEAECYKVEYLGKKSGENEECLQLKVTFNDNYTTDYFLDSRSYLLTKFVRLERHNPRGRVNTVTTYVSDYRRISNVWFACRFEIEKPNQKSIITIEHIDINPKDITSSIFSMK
jgi:hypothetical protein